MNANPSPVRAALIRMLSRLVGAAAVQCREATRLTSESRDRKLTTREKVSVRIHNKLCPECSAFEKQLVMLARYARTERDGCAFPDEAKKRIVEKLDREE